MRNTLLMTWGSYRKDGIHTLSKTPDGNIELTFECPEFGNETFLTPRRARQVAKAILAATEKK